MVTRQVISSCLDVSFQESGELDQVVSRSKSLYIDVTRI